jgi:hypothetical protein
MFLLRLLYELINEGFVIWFSPKVICISNENLFSKATKLDIFTVRN